VKRVLEALSLIELKPQVGPTGGGSDTNIMYTHGIMAPVIGMADNNAHTVREYVDIDELTDVARFCEKLIQYYKN
jgi:tripeptide aminopeptidase